MNMERNYMNHNEIYPILDMIKRRVNQMQNKGINHFFESPMLGDGGDGGFDTTQWQVESFEVERDTTNAIDPAIIKSITIIYVNGAVDRITLLRGFSPPVSKKVKDHIYINNLMIVEVTVTTEYGGMEQVMVATIFRDDGYGLFRKVEITYNGELLEWDDEDRDDEEIKEEDPNDFYNGGGYEQGRDPDIDNAEDFADSEYLPSDEPQVPEGGWADGYNPSNPTDIDVEEP